MILPQSSGARNATAHDPGPGQHNRESPGNGLHERKPTRLSSAATAGSSSARRSLAGAIAIIVPIAFTQNMSTARCRAIARATATR